MCKLKEKIYILSRGKRIKLLVSIISFKYLKNVEFEDV